MTKHEACLANIDRLERELFPEWFPEPQAPAVALMNKMAMIPRADLRDPPRELELRPGSRWPVTDHDDVRPANYTQVMRDPYRPRHRWETDPKTGALIPKELSTDFTAASAGVVSSAYHHAREVEKAMFFGEPPPRLVVVERL